jgi:ribosomal protein S18 acetylase RimI-like enzyme
VSGGIAIRPLAAADGADFRRLRLAALRHHPESFGMSHAEAELRDEAAFAAQLAGTLPPDLVLGAFRDGMLGGMAGLLVDKGAKARHRGMVWGVHVAPELRGRGVARALMRRLIAHARDHVELLHLTVTCGNAAAAALYRGLGFVPFGTQRRALKIGDRYFDWDMMQLDFMPGGEEG